MTTTALRRETLTADFYELDALLHSVCHSLIRQFGQDRLRAWGWDYEEIRGQSILLFVEAHDKFDPSRGKPSQPLANRFAEYVHCYVRNWFRDRIRTAYHREELLPRHWGEEELELHTDAMPFDDSELRKGLGGDARAVLDVILSMPEELFIGVPCSPDPQKVQMGYQRALNNMLTEAGWCAERIGRCFGELADAVSSLTRTRI